MPRWPGPASRAAFTILILAGAATAAPLMAQQQAPVADQPAITQTAPGVAPQAPQATASAPAASEDAARPVGPRVRPPVETARARFNTPDPIPTQDTVDVNHSYLVYILVVAVLVVLLVILLRRA